MLLWAEPLCVSLNTGHFTPLLFELFHFLHLGVRLCCTFYSPCLSQLRLPPQETIDCGVSNRNLFSPSSGGWKSEIRVLMGWLDEDSPCGLQVAIFLLGPQ